ncbi:MAG: hypothetical protein WC222_11750 [Parachlamydiales bacterium]|jgi:hypothetical protein
MQVSNGQPSPIQHQQAAEAPSVTKGTDLLSNVKFEAAPAHIPSRQSMPESHEANTVPSNHIAEETKFPADSPAQPPPENDEEMEFASGTFIAHDDSDDEGDMEFASGTFIAHDDDDEGEMNLDSGSMIVKDDPEDDDDMNLNSGSMIVKDDEDDDMNLNSGSMIVNDNDDEDMNLNSGTMLANDDEDMDMASGSMIVKEEPQEKTQEKAQPKASAAPKQPKGSGLPSYLTAHMQKGLAELPPQQHLAMNAGAAEEKKSQIVAKRNERINNPEGNIDLQDKWVLENGTTLKEHKELTEKGQLIPTIKTRRQALSDRKEELRSFVQQQQQHPVDKICAELYRNISTSTVSIRPASGGQGGAYFGNGVIVKPKGESALEMNNRKGYAAVTTTSRVRDAIPLYQENEREVASYEMAKVLNLGHITPPTVMAIISHESFGDITDRLEPSLQEKILHEAGPKDNEKVVTLQHMIQGGTTLVDTLDKWEQQSLENKAQRSPGEEHTRADANRFIRETVDQKSFEESSLLCFFLGENDGNVGNFLVVPKDDGKSGIVKIDNGLALPTRNEGFLNNLTELVIAKDKISPEGKAIINNANPAALATIADKYGLGDTSEATTERILFMKDVIKFYPDISLREMGVRLSLLNEGRDRALGQLTPTDMNEGKVKNPAKMQLPQSYTETKEEKVVKPQRDVNKALSNAPRFESEIAIKPLWQRKLEYEQAAKQREAANQPKAQDVVEKGRVNRLIGMFNK